MAAVSEPLLTGISDMQALPGTPNPDRYRIVRLLGRGGMGEVYLARDETLNRDVAIKFVAPERTADEDARRRLLHEARAAAALDHPYICAVHEAGETPDRRMYIVMHYVEGEPLASVLRRGPLGAREALVLCGQIAEALDAAHRRGVVHLDLKPGNVMFTAEGQPKLVDFGIARIVTATPEIFEADTESAVIPGAAFTGTPAYMSPEQAQQRPLDGRSDLFSLGAVLFECLTGRRAFEGNSALEIAASVLHVHPQAPSRIRPELDEGHDELCRRLLAKDPADRFQSAREVVGAIRVLVPDTSWRAAASASQERISRARPRRRFRLGIIVTSLAAVLCVGVWGWLWPYATLPRAPEDADVWYRRGTDALREGAYYTASKSLQRAVDIFPEHTLAYARLAEAHAELDDERKALDSLVRVVLPWRLPKGERLRIEAIRFLVTRDVDAAIGAYREIANLNPEDAGAWLDLGRAQEAAGLATDARVSYERAIAIDPQYAPAYLRLGTVEAFQHRPDAALKAFREAERLYEAAVNVEGQIEVRLRRGSVFDFVGELKLARADVERALSLATEITATHQQVRARLSLSSLAATEGRFADAERDASSAVQDALRSGLDSVAADGVIDLAGTLNQAGRFDEAEAHAHRAIQLADDRGARRTAARGRVQLAAVYQEQGRARDALETVSGVLPFLKENRYRRFELLALSIAARAHASRDELEQAQAISSSVLKVAETVNDDAQVALAATNLASVTSALGGYPDALRLRERAEEVHKRQGDDAALPYNLANRADLLIRLGRADDADVVLSELEQGIEAKIDSYIGRTRRAVFLRAFAAVTQLQCGDAMPLLRRLQAEGPAGDSPGALGPGLGFFCDARHRRRGSAASVPRDIDPTLFRERLYWSAAARVYRGEWQRALEDANAGLKLLGDTPNDELRWRLAAVGSLAARHLGRESIVAQLLETARASLARMEATWKGDLAPYRQRPDLADLGSRAGLN